MKVSNALSYAILPFSICRYVVRILGSGAITTSMVFAAAYI